MKVILTYKKPFDTPSVATPDYQINSVTIDNATNIAFNATTSNYTITYGDSATTAVFSANAYTLAIV